MTVGIARNRIRHLPATLKRSTYLYYLAAAAYAFSIALPHAILTPILLSKGMSFSDITFIQIGYSAAVLLFELPSGILSDIHSRKRVYLASKALIAAFFVLVLYADDRGLLFFAWAVYGLSAALDSGTIGNDVILNVRDHFANSPVVRASFVDYLVRIDSRIDGLFMLSGGATGAVLYQFIGIKLYWISTVGALLCFLLIFFFFPERKSHSPATPFQNTRQQFATVIRSGMTQLKSRIEIRNLICVLALTQIFFQTHFQLWQAFFLTIGFAETYFGFFYVAFQLISFAVSFISLQRVQNALSVKMFKVGSGVIALTSVTGLFVGAIAKHMWVTVAFYGLFVAVFWLILNHLNGQLRNDLDEESLSTMTSFSSMVARLASIIVLGLLTLTLKVFSVTLVVPAMFILAVIAISLLAVTRKGI